MARPLLLLFPYAVFALLGPTACADDETSNAELSITFDTSRCTEPRRLGDMLDSSDTCWAPPDNYCSGGAGGAVTRACSPDLNTCCDFGTTCIPCGWNACDQLPPPPNPAGPVYTADCRPEVEILWEEQCDTYMPSGEPFCLIRD